MFSPFSKTPVSASKSQKGRKSMLYMSPSSRKSTPGSRNISFNYSDILKTSVIEETANHVVEEYGCALPVLVTEALSMAERITDISVKLEPFGYASLVCGRQLFIWKYKIDLKAMKSVIHCKELTLPPSDLAHKAELVHLFETENSALPSALAVSPEGLVRYWPNINHEGSSVDAVTDLQGQECYSLISVFPLGCILATTTSSLVLVTPIIGEGQPNVICRPLRMPQGVLAGIGRKVSSFIFGVVPPQASEAKQLNRVLSTTDEDEHFLYVLSSNTFQKWHISKDNSDQLLFETDLDRQIKQNFVDALFKSDSCLIPNFKIWCLDMQLTKSGVIILIAGTLPSRPGYMYYAFGTLMTDSDLPPQNFSSFCVTKHYENYQEEAEEKLLSYKFMLPTPDNQFSYVYNSEKILSFQMGAPSESDEVDLKNLGSKILGSGTCDGLPLFFTNTFGIVSFVPNQAASSAEASLLLSSVKEVKIREPDPRKVAVNVSDKLRAAVCSYCNGDMKTCESLIKEIAPDHPLSPDDSTLDDAVVAVSLEIIDDYPVSDPRWCESVPAGMVSSSLIIAYQLDDKLKAHEYLINFLKAFDLFDRLSNSKVGDVLVSTNAVLCEHAEKLIASKSLRVLLTDHKDVIETAIKKSLQKRYIEVKTHLTHQDVFFREVSAIGNIFPSLIECEEEELAEDVNVPKILNIVMNVNKIFSSVLNSVVEYRQNKLHAYNLQNENFTSEFEPWTSQEGNNGIRTLIRRQLNVNVDHTLKISTNIQVQGVLFQQYIDLLDCLLDSYKWQLNNDDIEQKTLQKNYEAERNQFIKPLLALGQHDRAAGIAEKYLDFDILVQICEETQNKERLQRYMIQFHENNFSEFVFKWYINRGEKGKLFDKHLLQKDDRARFLHEHENLKWLHYIQENQYDSAHAVLKELALRETKSVTRKKTMLSISKLCALVSDISEDAKSNQIEAINLEDDLIAHQEALPLSIVEAFGLDARNMRVFQPEELIEMYITEENTGANEYDFKMALDLLHFIKKSPDDPELNNLRMHIWSKAIMRDNWEELDINNPLEAIKETIFFQVIELAFEEGIEMHDFIPAVEDLLQVPELNDLAESRSFEFLLRIGYENILKIID